MKSATSRTVDGKSCLHVAVELDLLGAVRSLCKSGADLNAKDPVTAVPPLWTALENGILSSIKEVCVSKDIFFPLFLNSRIKSCMSVKLI